MSRQLAYMDNFANKLLGFFLGFTIVLCLVYIVPGVTSVAGYIVLSIIGGTAGVALAFYFTSFRRQVLQELAAIYKTDADAITYSIYRELKAELKQNITNLKNAGENKILHVLIWRFILLYCFQKLASGQLHVYRGVLASYAHGYREVFVRAGSVLIIWRDITKDEFAAISQNLNDLIKTSG